MARMRTRSARRRLPPPSAHRGPAPAASRAVRRASRAAGDAAAAAAAGPGNSLSAGRPKRAGQPRTGEAGEAARGEAPREARPSLARRRPASAGRRTSGHAQARPLPRPNGPRPNTMAAGSAASPSHGRSSTPLRRHRSRRRHRLRSASKAKRLPDRHAAVGGRARGLKRRAGSLPAFTPLFRLEPALDAAWRPRGSPHAAPHKRGAHSAGPGRDRSRSPA